MARKIVCENYLNEKITFEFKFPFFLESVDGLHEVTGVVAGMKSAYAIGENYIGTTIEKRNIIIKGAIRDDVITNRQKLYRQFPLKSTGTLYYYEDDLERKIDYKVESIQIDDKGLHKHFQISLICPDPYFTDLETTSLQMATWSPAFKFLLKIPKDTGIKFGTKNTTSMATIENDTNIEFGMTITFTANDDVVNPSMFNVDTREEMKIEKKMSTGDKIIVNTYRQNKNIIYIPVSTGIEENINNLMVYGSKFLQVHHGSNTFRYNADDGEDNLEAVIEYVNEYEAV
jgi:hypothetical protein